MGSEAVGSYDEIRGEIRIVSESDHGRGSRGYARKGGIDSIFQGDRGSEASTCGKRHNHEGPPDALKRITTTQQTTPFRD